MVIVKLYGGLGNQMFQYAAARRLAVAHGAELVMDISRLVNQPPTEEPREYELHFLNPKGRIINKPAEARRAFPFFGKPKLLKIQESHLGFDQNILNLPDNVLLIGHWQSYKYFEDAQKHIKEDFTFANPLSRGKQEIVNQIKKIQHPVSLQVRRGDMAHNPATRKYHGLVPMSYYRKAVEIVAAKTKNPHFFVISDDSEWCKKNLNLGCPTTFVESVPGTGHEDMNIMSKCQHHVIANSSFGWWGSWLDPNPDKIVVTPKKWFKEAETYPDDRFPEAWIKL